MAFNHMFWFFVNILLSMHCFASFQSLVLTLASLATFVITCYRVIFGTFFGRLLSSNTNLQVIISIGILTTFIFNYNSLTNVGLNMIVKAQK